MKSMAAFQTDECRGYYRPAGMASAGQAADMIATALELARDADLRSMLIDITKLDGIEIPGPAFRRWAVRRWAAAAARLSVAVVARVEHICPQKIGLVVAAEEGMGAHICSAEDEALAWLDAVQHETPQKPGSPVKTHTAGA
jgi:hypothetical protein